MRSSIARVAWRTGTTRAEPSQENRVVNAERSEDPPAGEVDLEVRPPLGSPIWCSPATSTPISASPDRSRTARRSRTSSPAPAALAARAAASALDRPAHRLDTRELLPGAPPRLPAPNRDQDPHPRCLHDRPAARSIGKTRRSDAAELFSRAEPGLSTLAACPSRAAHDSARS
jgi:hypothetical protein